MISYKDAEKKQSEELQRLIEFFGSEYRLAKALELSPQAVNGWKKRGRISASMAIEVEKMTKGRFTKRDLRPDVIKWIDEE